MRRKFLLGAGILLILLSTHGFNLYSSDEVYYFKAAWGLVTEGNPAVPSSIASHLTRTGRGGRTYSQYPAGQSLLLLPWIAAGRATIRYLGDSPDRSASAILIGRISSMNGILMTLVSLLALDSVLHRLGAPHRRSILLILIALSGTQAWYYAGTLFSEPSRSAFVILSLALILGRERMRSLAWYPLAFASLIRLDTVVLFPFFLMLLPRGKRLSGGTITHLALSLILLASGTAWWNWIRFGSPLTTGYSSLDALAISNIPEGLAVYGLSLSMGVPIFAPVILLGLGRGLLRGDSRIRIILLSALALTLVYLSHRGWANVWQWGPRYFHTIGLLAVTGLALAEDLRPAFLLAGYGALVNILGRAADINLFYSRLHDPQDALWSLSNPPFIGQIESIRSGAWDLPFWTAASWPIGLALLAGGVLMIVLSSRKS